VLTAHLSDSGDDEVSCGATIDERLVDFTRHIMMPTIAAMTTVAATQPPIMARRYSWSSDEPENNPKHYQHHHYHHYQHHQIPV